ncbi:hypothetical protein [Cellulomonas fengjieae]|uniref:hypothetical protein n=1 Tax=Cellulomonas fengjieae TaxID=2819978 RepID=UPI001AAF7E52|nr:hypothetical protein [Cellulomonas fengjieae]MBO3103373.1 hypothetical protein [Cellulomonas fengjieae]
MTDAHTPTIPSAWRDELIIALRARDMPGARIGEVLAEVDEFCTDSGLDAPTAFGSPAAYAASLTAPAGGTRAGLRDDLRTVGRILPGFLGLMVVQACLGDDGPDLVVTAGWLAGLPVMLLATVLTVRSLGRSTATGWRAHAVPVAVIVATLAVVVALILLLTTPVVTVPDAVAFPLAALLLLGPALAGTQRARRRPTADVVSDPRADPDQVRRDNVRADVLAAWILPGFAVIGVGVTLGLNAMLDLLA